MDTEIMVGAHPILGVCNLCLNEGAVKSMLVPHINMGKLEIYSKMLLNCFSIDISQTELGDMKRLICFPCIDKLRECETFRTMVQQSLNTLKENVKLLKGEKVANIKEEVDDIDTEDNDLDDVIHKDDDFDENAEVKVANIKEEADDIDTEVNDLDDVIHKDDDFDENEKVANIKEEIDDIDIEDIDLDHIKHKNDDFDKDELRPFMAKWNAEVVLVYSTVYPFKIKANTLMCVYCCEKYEDPDSYRQHIDDAHPTVDVATAFSRLGKQYLKVDCTNLKCRICSEPITSIEDMAKHLKELHENSQTRNINLDFDVGLQPYRLENNKWNCVICEKKMASLTKLCRHTPSHYKRYTCDQCGRGYLTKGSLTYHVKCQHMGKYVCRKCWKNFPSKVLKRSHIRSSRRCWPSYYCTICRERFLSWEQKNKHLIDFHGRKKTTYTCPDCTKVFDSSGNLYNHYKVEHTDEIYLCSCCGLKFNTKKRLEEHRNSHTAEKKYKCQVCSESFKRIKDWNEHMWIHNEMKRFICLICDKQFEQKVDLKEHFKSTHPNLKIEF